MSQSDMHHAGHARRLSQVCTPRVGLAQIGWGLPRVDVWMDRLWSARDRLMASPRFRHWAAAFPLTRPVARRRSRDLFDLCAGFVYSQVLLACVRLRLFDILSERSMTAHEVSRRLGMADEAAERLLRAAVSLRLLARRGEDRFGLGPLGAALVGNPGLTAMVEHHAMLYDDLRDPVALLRGECRRTELSGYWPYAGAERPADLTGPQVAAYSALMAASQPLIAEEVLAAYPLDRHRCLMDVGGGEGAFVSAAASRFPKLRAVLFDLPAVAQRARERFRADGLDPRASVAGGDFLSDPLPSGADVVSLVRVLHDHDDAGALAILRAVRQALGRDGTLLIAEPMAEAAGAEPVGDAYFGFYLLAMGRGHARSPREITALLHRAGFGGVRRHGTAMPLLTGVITARPAD
ncbi:acetylserotonin O-methyltransferase [Skermanella rosea]|uniref:acetylserotonin O-methyltransferase n=1 Tax=Skermanella rosea TaxID=1817965 RepID=UPI001E3CC923|nr:acetylserotonin O-methyltransferase [Skermanella rosea]UEM01375.1 acetylserotonin O-methyltransferase [Skermanella rosea]